MIFLYIFFGLIFIEFILRCYFHSSTDEENNNIKRIPNLSLKRMYFVKSDYADNTNAIQDSKFGWKLKKNSELTVNVRTPYIKDSLNYNYKTNDKGARTEKYSGKKKTLGFFGCSITYGHGLNEKETFAYQVCEKKEDFEYLNFGVAGYSLYQSLLRLKEVTKEVNLDKAIFTVHKDLERRNTCSFSWLKNINRAWSVPGIILLMGLKIKIRPRKYIKFPNFKIKIINLIEFLINFLLYSCGDLKIVKRKTNEFLLKEIKKECENNKIELIILCLDNINNLSEFLNENKFNWNFSGISLGEENDKGENKWLLMPWDNHPNQKANKIFAEKIVEVIDSSNRPHSPKLKAIAEEKDPQEFIYPLY